MARESAAWRLDSIAPPDNTFRDAGEDVHREFWQFIAARGVDRFRWRCNQGLDRYGRGLTPIAESTRRKGRWRSYTGQGTPDNPPLVPALGRSRFESLLKGRGFVDHAEWHWTTDPVTGLQWGQVALWHREGGKGRLPVRDVIGWSADDIAWLRNEGAKWWYGYQHGLSLAKAGEALGIPPEQLEAIHTRIGPSAPVTGKFKVTGRVDAENFTFGHYDSPTRFARAVAEGNTTGFRQLGKRKKPPAGGARPGPAPGTKPRPKPAPKVPGAAAIAARVAAAAQAPHRIDLPTFAAAAHKAAQSVQGPGRFSEHKVFISHAHAAYELAHGELGLPSFKRLLARSGQARLIELRRADMVEAMSELDVGASSTFHPAGAGEFHFILTE